MRTTVAPPGLDRWSVGDHTDTGPATGASRPYSRLVLRIRSPLLALIVLAALLVVGYAVAQ